MGFGGGPHHCIGNILGRTTIPIAIRRMLARFPRARLADPDFVPSYGGAVGELRLNALPMKIREGAQRPASQTSLRSLPKLDCARAVRTRARLPKRNTRRAHRRGA